MLRILSVAIIVSLVGLAAWGAITIYDENLKVGRMWETPGVRPHENPLPVMDGGSIPADGGELRLRLSDPTTLRPPFDINQPEMIAAGQKGYGYYCIQCHGKYFDGNGTVGQSFAPLPGDLRSAKIQSLSMGKIFHEISYGVPGGRQPALATTISIEERWQIVGYIQSLGLRP